ncbi:protein FAM161B-like [Littorina saxatilis]|uniref:FAM161 centrosomal protein A n=1 Tax=Littorina saxatilis TaxID=31220 RepID=A0AAN9GD45_9CAEN
MATMATTSHGLSVYVNSCVKNPLDSRTGASTTFAERKAKISRFAVTDPGPRFDSSDEFNEAERFDLGGSLPVPATYEDVETQLKHLTDEHFYLKLQQLKDANRKTLDECEKLYQEKHGSEGKELDSLTAKDIVEEMFAARLAVRSGHVDGSTSSLQFCGDFSDRDARDRAQDLSSKPPRIPTSQRESNLSKTSPVRSAALPSYSGYSKARPMSAPLRGQQPRRAYSLDGEDWRNAMRDSSHVSDDEVRSEGPLDPEFLASVTKIRDMWRGFKIDDYSPGERRHSSASVARQKKKKKEENDIADSWRHRITIPKPFSMSMREESKPKQKTKVQMELELQRFEKKRQEEEECQKKFKAQPAPAHIYLPLYDEIQEKNETRRRYAKQYCKDILKSQEKPFSFTKREEEKKQQRFRSATIAERIAHSAQQAKTRQPTFVARPVPGFVYDTAQSEKLMEDEEYRKIRIKMRARELLKESSLPPNMALHQKLKEQQEKEKLMKTKQEGQGRRKHRSSHKVPDYDFLYREFQKELARRKHARDPTVMEPFDLETNHLRSSHKRVLRDMERDDKLMKSTAKGTQRPGYMSSSMDSIPLRSSISADLRTGSQRTHQDREARRRQQQEEEDRRRHMRETKLRKYILERSDNTPRVDDHVKERLKQHRQAEISRLEEYERQLEEIKSKVEKRPLLFERETQASAGKAAEKKFKSTLKSAGVDEDLLRTRSSGASVDYDRSDEERDLTVTKSRVGFEDEEYS